ncbi:MAG: alpha/beta hydrolase [Propionibacteriales bacterium]|nr:alpha/beta hydrolase [Propionibacteriales bacterium]
MTELEAGLATIDQWFLTADDGFDLWVREGGAGDPVVAVHGGFGIEHSELVEPLTVLTETHRVHWYDQRGSIRSPGSSSEQLESITFDAHVTDLIMLAEEVGPTILVAHSIGTLIAMAALRRRPDLFREMVLVGAIPATGFSQSLKGQAWLAQRERQAEALISRLGLDSADLGPREAQLKWRILFASGNAAADDAWRTIRWPGRTWYRTEVADLSDRGVPESFDFTPELSGHARPVTVIIGDTDYIDFGAEAWQDIAAITPNVTLRIIDQCGHNPWYDRPEAFRDELLTAVGLDS